MAAPVASSGSQTIVKNVSGATRSFGFIPPHGRTLADNEQVTVSGDIYSHLKTKRKRDGFEAALASGSIVVLQGTGKEDVRLFAVDDSSVINAGDLVWLDTDDVKAAADISWNTNLATTQADFANVFVGVALQDHENGGGAITDFPVDVSPDAVYNFTCTSETHEVGALLGPAKDSGNALLSDTLEVAVAASSIARCVTRDASAATDVDVKLQSSILGHNAAGAQ